MLSHCGYQHPAIDASIEANYVRVTHSGGHYFTAYRRPGPLGLGGCRDGQIFVPMMKVNLYLRSSLQSAKQEAVINRGMS